jgi:hypothetical protein
MNLRSRILTAALVAVCSSMARAQDLPWQSESKPSAKSAVSYQYPEQISITAKQPSLVEMHFRVADGLHINSHTPHEKSFIATNLAVLEPVGLKVSAVDFPPGQDYAFSFAPKEKLSVYAGEFVLRAHVTAQPGDHLLQGTLRFQACDSNSCYPPKTIPLAIDVIAK